MAKQRIRIRLKPTHTDCSTVGGPDRETAQRTGATSSDRSAADPDREVHRPAFSVHRQGQPEQFEIRTHKRLVDILDPSSKTVDALMDSRLRGRPTSKSDVIPMSIGLIAARLA